MVFPENSQTEKKGNQWLSTSRGSRNPIPVADPKPVGRGGEGGKREKKTAHHHINLTISPHNVVPMCRCYSECSREVLAEGSGGSEPCGGLSPSAIGAVPAGLFKRPGEP